MTTPIPTEETLSLLEEALDSALSILEPGGDILVCRGARLCDGLFDPNHPTCPWCYRIDSEDERSLRTMAEDILNPPEH